MMNKENFWNALAMCKTTADRLDLLDARDAEWQARMDKLEAALKECSGIRSMVESIERGESYEGGKPDIGTCRLLGNIKRISDKAHAAIAESEADHE